MSAYSTTTLQLLMCRWYCRPAQHRPVAACAAAPLTAGRKSTSYCTCCPLSNPVSADSIIVLLESRPSLPSDSTHSARRKPHDRHLAWPAARSSRANTTPAPMTHAGHKTQSLPLSAPTVKPAATCLTHRIYSRRPAAPQAETRPTKADDQRKLRLLKLS